MARNGSGTYSLPAGNPVVSGTTISSTVQNNTMSDIATALTQSIASTGVTTPTANLPMGNFRHTGVGNATALSQYASATDVQNGSIVVLSSVAGTNTITATAPLSMAAYAAGQTFRFTAANTITGATTINLNGLGAKAITKLGTLALVPNDIVAGQVVQITYDGTQFQMAQTPGANFFIGNTTRDLSLATGTQAITGVGFKPRAVLILAGKQNTNTLSLGWATSSASGYVFNNIPGGGLWWVDSGAVGIQITGVADQQAIALQSMDSDGFTLSWTKTGAPSGATVITYLAIR